MHKRDSSAAQFIRGLPSPPLGKSGWPWRGQNVGLSDPEASAGICPNISIVTPSYNQAAYIEETIRSVLLQGYPNLEYIVIDGGSTDGSLEVIEKYDQWLAYWISEPDRGQSHALNKGFARAGGEVLGYLNSDDILLPGALHAVAECYQEQPEADLVHGSCQIVSDHGEHMGDRQGEIKSLEEILNLWEVWWGRRNFVQPEVFWTRRIADRVGPFREDLQFVMDYDYWTRILAAGGKVAKTDRALAAFRITPQQKSRQSDKAAEELLALVQPLLWSFSTDISLPTRLRLQGMWLYQQRFLPEAARSLAAGELKRQRWLRLCGCLLRYPQILLAPGIHGRVRAIAAGHRHLTS